MVDSVAIQMDGPGARLYHAIENIGERCLAGTVRADEPDELRPFDLEGDSLQDVQAAEVLVDVADVEPDHGALSAFSAADGVARRFSTVSRNVAARSILSSAVCTRPLRMKRSVSMSTSPKKTRRHTDMSIVTPANEMLLRRASSANSMTQPPIAAATMLSSPPMTAIAITRLICSKSRMFGVMMPM